MLRNVTWGQFIEGMIVLVIIYYIYIGLKYYRKEIKSFLSKLTNRSEDSTSESFSTSENADDSFEELEAVVNDLKVAVLERVGRNASKDELLELLKERLSVYSGLHRPAYRVAINNYIIKNANEICGVMFSEYELNSAWETLLR